MMWFWVPRRDLEQQDRQFGDAMDVAHRYLWALKDTLAVERARYDQLFVAYKELKDRGFTNASASSSLGPQEPEVTYIADQIADRKAELARKFKLDDPTISDERADQAAEELMGLFEAGY